MTDDPGSLANLRDLVTPPPVSYWPPAPGVWIALAGVVAMLAVAAWRGLERRRANAYRRAAVADLDALAASIDGGASTAVAQISSILKRAALVAYPRERVAPLSGPAWAAFLAETGGKGFDARPSDALFAGALDQSTPPQSGALPALAAQARNWITGHAAPAKTEGS